MLNQLVGERCWLNTQTSNTRFQSVTWTTRSNWTEHGIDSQILHWTLLSCRISEICWYWLSVWPKPNLIWLDPVADRLNAIEIANGYPVDGNPEQLQPNLLNPMELQIDSTLQLDWNTQIAAAGELDKLAAERRTTNGDPWRLFERWFDLNRWLELTLNGMPLDYGEPSCGTIRWYWTPNQFQSIEPTIWTVVDLNGAAIVEFWYVIMLQSEPVILWLNRTIAKQIDCR